MKKAIKYVGRIVVALLLFVIIWGLWNQSLVAYGWMQLKGQMHIVSSSRPVEEVLADPLVTDSIKTRLKFIYSIRRFAIDSLGLKDSKNYTTFYDQQEKPLLWVLTASEPFRLLSYTWKFPVVGEVSYKGYFEKAIGLQEDSLLRVKGYDTEFGDVSAWSTLGWFRDPILSSMLNRSDGQLAELLIHEMTHATLYVKSDVSFNENLASAVGEAGAEKFLDHYFGSCSSELNDYLLRKRDLDLFSNHMLHATKILDTLYLRIEHLDDSLKYKFKQDRILEVVNSLDTLSFNFPERYRNTFSKNLPNNAYFLSFVRYDSQKAAMREELKRDFGDDISSYLEAVRQRNR